MPINLNDPLKPVWPSGIQTLKEPFELNVKRKWTSSVQIHTRVNMSILGVLLCNLSGSERERNVGTMHMDRGEKNNSLHVAVDYANRWQYRVRL